VDTVPNRSRAPALVMTAMRHADGQPQRSAARPIHGAASPDTVKKMLAIAPSAEAPKRRSSRIWTAKAPTRNKGSTTDVAVATAVTTALPEDVSTSPAESTRTRNEPDAR
jgi:hypothetical protein